MITRARWLAIGAVLLLVGCGETPQGRPADTGTSDQGPGLDAVASSDGVTAGDLAAQDAGPGVDATPAADALPAADTSSPDTGVAKCTLTPSGPVEAQKDGEVIENLLITAKGQPAIRVEGKSKVTIRNVRILHEDGQGIVLSNADDVTIEQVSIEHTGAPPTGANASEENNITCYQSARATIAHVRLTRGSTGIYLISCPESKLSFIEGHDIRGPFPRGQLVQWDKSDDGLLEDFSVINPQTSWPEDNVNVYQSNNLTIRRGLIDGNNSPSGVGVIFDGGDATGLVEDVDAIRMGNGCFSAYDGGDGTIFRRTRCRENICGDQGRGVPLSNALMWAGQPGLTQLRIEDSSYFASCNDNLVWPQDSFAVVELNEVDFKLRAAIVNTFCWD